MHSLGSDREFDTVSTAQYLYTSCISVGKHSNQYAFRVRLSRASLICYLLSSVLLPYLFHFLP